MTHKIQDFSRLLGKIQGFQGLELGPMKFKAFQDFQGPVWTLLCNYLPIHEMCAAQGPAQWIQPCLGLCSLPDNFVIYQQIRIMFYASTMQLIMFIFYQIVTYFSMGHNRSSRIYFINFLYILNVLKPRFCSFIN